MANELWIQKTQKRTCKEISPVCAGLQGIGEGFTFDRFQIIPASFTSESEGCYEITQGCSAASAHLLMTGLPGKVHLYFEYSANMFFPWEYGGESASMLQRIFGAL